MIVTHFYQLALNIIADLVSVLLQIKITGSLAVNVKVNKVM